MVLFIGILIGIVIGVITMCSFSAKSYKKGMIDFSMNPSCLKKSQK